MTLGDHLKRRRFDLGLYQKDVATAIKVNVWTYLLWENDRTAPGIRLWPRILEFLGYSPFPSVGTLGERILAARRQSGLSRKRVAALLTADEATVSRWENNLSKPKDAHMRDIQSFLDDNGC